MSVRVLLADDQALLRAGFRVLIDSAPDLQVVAEASNGRQAVDLARSSRADVVLMDIRMPEVDGLQATQLISADEDLAGARLGVGVLLDEDLPVANGGGTHGEPAYE